MSLSLDQHSAFNSLSITRCDCNKGYELVHGSCEDINECLDDPCEDTERCSNVEGQHFLIDYRHEFSIKICLKIVKS